MPPEEDRGLGFRSWHHATIKASVAAIQDGIGRDDSEGKEDNLVTPDSGCTMSVIVREFLHSSLSDCESSAGVISRLLIVGSKATSPIAVQSHLELCFSSKALPALFF